MSWSAWLGSIYPDDAACTRLRINPVRDAVVDLGGDAETWSFQSSSAYADWMSERTARRLLATSAGAGTLVRGIRGARSCDVAVIQREALPFNSLLVERAIDAPLVWDVDDYLWTAVPPKSTLRGGLGKYRWLCHRAAEVWAGNRSIADWCVREGARKVELVLASVPIPDRVSEPSEPPRLAWVGTPTTGPFIEQLLHELEAELRDFEIDIVGARVDSPASLRVHRYAWSREVEERVLRRAWAGLYPIDVSHPMALGKSALKAVLYMSYGVPVIATRTPSNEDVLTDGVEGFLAADMAQWRQALKELRSPEVRRSLGAAGRARALREFDATRRYRALGEKLQRYALA